MAVLVAGQLKGSLSEWTKEPIELRCPTDRELARGALDALRGAGIHNYSIFRHGDQLFAYCEVEDFERMVRTLADDPVNARWQEYMAPMIGFDLDPASGFPRLLPETFHMD